MKFPRLALRNARAAVPQFRDGFVEVVLFVPAKDIHEEDGVEFLAILKIPNPK